MLKLTKNKFAIVDDNMIEFLSIVPWQAYLIGGKYYAARRFHIGKRPNRVGKMEYLHRMIMDAPSGMVVDHINGNTLDNRRENLRLCLSKENVRYQCPKRGKYKGVFQHKGSSLWSAQIKKDGTRYSSCGFATAEDAAEEYNRLALLHFGEFAFLNTMRSKW